MCIVHISFKGLYCGVIWINAGYSDEWELTPNPELQLREPRKYQLNAPRTDGGMALHVKFYATLSSDISDIIDHRPYS